MKHLALISRSTSPVEKQLNNFVQLSKTDWLVFMRKITKNNMVCTALFSVVVDTGQSVF
jgi:hypothetical protein